MGKLRVKEYKRIYKAGMKLKDANMAVLISAMCLINFKPYV